MLAPVALYPDVLLSQVLMAATYPIEVVEADSWLRAYPYLQGESLDRNLAGQDWDPSVKSLCHFPSILALMSERIGETTDLGNAFLAQEYEVMDMIQELRAAAHAQGHLYATAEQRVIFDGRTIIIEPVTPSIYVPYYDPYTIYGSWWYPEYPPYHWAPQDVTVGFGISYWPGIHFSFAFVSWSRFDWPRRQVYIDVQRRPRYVRQDHWVEKSRWQHAPSHRRGVAYHDKSTALKYGQPSHGVPSRSDARVVPQHREQYRPADNPQSRSDRQRISNQQTTSSRQARTGIENPKIPQEKRMDSRSAPTHINEKPARTVWKETEPPKQPKQNARIEKQPDNPTWNHPEPSNAVMPNPTQHVVKEQAWQKKQPVAIKNLKRQGTPRATPPSREDRGQVQSSRDKAAGRIETGHKDHPTDAKGRSENPDRDNDADLKSQPDTTNGNSRFDRSPSRGRERE